MNDGGTGGTLVLRAGNSRLVQKVRARRTGLTDARRSRFIEVLAATCNVRLASQAAGMDYSLAYRARRKDAGFATAWDEALASGYARLETEALRYALERLPDAIDPEAMPEDDERARAIVAGSQVTRLVERRASDADLRFVLSMLGRYARGTTGGTMRVAPLSEADTDARLTALLDKLERQSAR
ncbi:hypothetical protein [uncultured Sphingomonas sp.]|uniref:hypothetical protein n=1 Tax=uncultured Sphingomonas sp. TaxID=158754 RepID=UPI0025DCE15F|nr:hypothetical protein [uncultured Sphingomonas sp.]